MSHVHEPFGSAGVCCFYITEGTPESFSGPTVVPSATKMVPSQAMPPPQVCVLGAGGAQVVVRKRVQVPDFLQPKFHFLFCLQSRALF